jgi:hypothetical protein
MQVGKTSERLGERFLKRRSVDGTSRRAERDGAAASATHVAASEAGNSLFLFCQVTSDLRNE